MPTGYTAGVEDGTVTDFRVFALTCARAFDSECYDTPMDFKIPDEVKPSSYHDDRHKKLAIEDMGVRVLSDSNALKMATEKYEHNVKEWERVGKEWSEKNSRFSRMVDKVLAWEPPTKDHEGLKKFMLEQLQISMHKGHFWPKPTKPTSGDAWRKSEVESLEKEIEYHRVEYLKEVERCRERNEWVRALKKSLAELEAR